MFLHVQTYYAVTIIGKKILKYFFYLIKTISFNRSKLKIKFNGVVMYVFIEFFLGFLNYKIIIWIY